MQRIALAIFGLWFWTGAALAGDNVIARDSVIFNVMPATPGYFNLGDGQYIFKYHAVIRKKDEYFADQQFFSNADWERGQRLRIVFDQAGRAFFEPKIKFVSKSDDGALESLDRLSDRWLRYATWIKQGKSMDPPGELDDYKKDGMLVEKRRGGGDPFGTSARVSFAGIGDDLSRTDELNYDRSLIVLSETPLASRSVQSTLDECPALVNNHAEHVLKANAFDFSLFKVRDSYVLAPTGIRSMISAASSATATGSANGGT
ncbi:MAG: hypothetical protein ACOZAM_31840 [Pseudomonadota bacterium]